MLRPSCGPGDRRGADDGGGPFRTICAEKAAAAEQAGARWWWKAQDGWLFLPAELRHIGAGRFWGEDAAKVCRATDPAAADPLPAILDFKRQLAEAGIELIFVPVPPKAIIYPEGLAIPSAGARATHSTPSSTSASARKA